jgi:hypothetical protein
VPARDLFSAGGARDSGDDCRVQEYRYEATESGLLLRLLNEKIGPADAFIERKQASESSVRETRPIRSHKMGCGGRS